MSTATVLQNSKIVSREEWRQSRPELLAAEKELTRQHDALTRRRIALPWQYKNE